MGGQIGPKWPKWSFSTLFRPSARTTLAPRNAPAQALADTITAAAPLSRCVCTRLLPRHGEHRTKTAFSPRQPYQRQTARNLRLHTGPTSCASTHVRVNKRTRGCLRQDGKSRLRQNKRFRTPCCVRTRKRSIGAARQVAPPRYSVRLRILRQRSPLRCLHTPLLNSLPQPSYVALGSTCVSPLVTRRCPSSPSAKWQSRPSRGIAESSTRASPAHARETRAVSSATRCIQQAALRARHLLPFLLVTAPNVAARSAIIY